MGYSMGGLIALATALRFPDRVRALVVMGAHPFAQDMAPYRLAVAESIKDWLAMVEVHGIELSSATRRRILANDIRALQACAAHDRPDMSAALAALRSPLLAIAGTQDPVFEAVKALARCTGGSFVALEDRNHVTGFLDVDAVVSAVDEFLTSAGSSSPGRGD
jgi:pimeloyl-ACP methyl ester carboxylesterase